MSFILDALKKSESERQRQSGPALFEVKIAPPRHRFAIWAVALGALLAINLVVVGWMLSRSSSARSAARVAAAQAPGTAAGPGTAPASAPAAAAAAGAMQRSPAAAPGASSPAAPATGANPNAGTAAAAPPAPAGSGQPAGPEAVARLNASPPPAATGAAVTNPEDLAPAVEPARGSAAPDSAGSVVREPASGLPSYQDAAAAPGANIPPLKLDLHVYSPKPDQRFVFLNMVKLHEGEALPQGVRVDAITPDGVILSYHGTRFMLQNH